MSVLLPEAIEQMKHHEGVRQKPYLCPAHIWTVGVGRVLYHDQIKLPMVRKGGVHGSDPAGIPHPARRQSVMEHGGG
jgi:hypothetical protein